MIKINRKESTKLTIRANRILSKNRKTVDPQTLQSFNAILKKYKYNTITDSSILDKAFIYSTVKKGYLSNKSIKYLNRILRSSKVNKPRVNKRNKTSKYRTYIESPLWENRKNEYYKNHLKKCNRCGSCRYVSLHHMYYDYNTFGTEPDDILVPLCSSCHKEYHRIYGTKKDMIATTMSFIESFNKSTETIIPRKVSVELRKGWIPI